MKKASFFTSLPFKLLVGVIVGIIAGLILSSTDSYSITMGILNVVVTLKYILGQLINFCVPLIIIGFIAPSITKLGNSASRMLGVALVIAYVSSIGAALFSVAAGYTLIPHLSIVTNVDGLKELPEVVFELSIPQIMSVMSALVFSIHGRTCSLPGTRQNLLQVFLMNSRRSYFLLCPRSSSGTSFLYRTDFLRTGLRRFYHQTASCFSQSYCNRTNRTFYLDDTSVCSCRYLFS